MFQASKTGTSTKNHIVRTVQIHTHPSPGKYVNDVIYSKNYIITHGIELLTFAETEVIFNKISKKMKMNKLLTSVTVVALVLIAGCQKNEITKENSGVNMLKSGVILSNQTLVQATVPLGSASTFAVLGGTTVTNAEASIITGDAGVSPGTALTGFEPEPINTIEGPGTVTAGLGVVSETIYAGGPVAAQAHNDAVLAYNYLVAQVPDVIYSGVTQLDGMTFTPGVYSFAPSANLQVGGTLKLDFQGNSDALFIFQVGTTLVTMTNSNVIAVNPGTSDCSGSNVYWAVGTSATIDGDSFIGTVIATTTITMTNTGNASGATNVTGRMLALGGAVTMVKSIISICGTSDGGTDPPDPIEICRDFVTGGGWINDKETFGVSGGIRNGKFWGQLSYNDHGMKGKGHGKKGKDHGKKDKKDDVKVKSTSVTGYFIIDAVTRQIEGTARLNGKTPVTYTVIVTDNGEPGRNDTFSIVLSNGYSASGTLKGGNIQLHKVCGETQDHGDKEDCYDKDEQDGHRNSDNDDYSDNDDD